MKEVHKNVKKGKKHNGTKAVTSSESDAPKKSKHGKKSKGKEFEKIELPAFPDIAQLPRWKAQALGAICRCAENC